MNSVSDVASQVDRAFWIIGMICLVLLIAVTATMIMFVIKYHRRRTRTTRQISVNYPLEITWTVLPTLLVLFMFFVGYKGFRMMRDVPPGAKVVQVIAQQWVWSFVYPDEQITSNELYLPVDAPVRLELTSRDVIHSFYLPAFRVKEDAVPGRTDFLWIQPRKTGTYSIFCAELCGRGHSKMYTTLHVVSKADYDKWIDQKIADKNKPIVIAEAMNPQSDEIKRRDGGKLFLTYCASCHGQQGQGGIVAGARNFTQLTGWKRSPKITDILRTITEGIAGTQMRSFSQLPPWDRFALAHHVVSFYKGTDRPIPTPEDIKQLVKDYALDKPPEPQRRIPIERAMKIIADEQKPSTQP